MLLGVLLTLQVMLGVESWLGKFAGVLVPEMRKPTIGQAATRVAHVLVGSFILATSVVQTVLLHRFRVAGSLRESERTRGANALHMPAMNTLVQQLEGTA